MKKGFIAAFAAASIMLSSHVVAQEKFTVSGKADFVSDYIWRGMDQNSGFSVQPSLTLSWYGVSLNCWGSQSLTKWEDGGAKEFDINLSYSIKGFTVTVSDYWWSGVNKPYGHYRNSHYFEGTLAYSFADLCPKFPLAISWSTMFAGADRDTNPVTGELYGKLRGSTYVNFSCPVALPADITLTPALSFTPWKGMYHNKAAITDISLKANKDIKITDNFSIPLFAQVIVAPQFDRTYIVAGFTLGF